MTEISIRQFKQLASEVARRVSGGKEIIVITNPGQAVPRLVPEGDAESKLGHAGGGLGRDGRNSPTNNRFMA